MALLLGLLVACTGILLYLLGPWGEDIWTHLFRSEEIHTNLANGQWETVFSTLKSAHRPLPVYVYYSQWIYWLPALLCATGMTAFAALKTSIFLLHMVALSGCWLLLRRHAGTLPALLGTLLFASSNYVVGEIFIRGAYAELFCYSLLPLALYVTGNAVQGRRGNTALLTAVLAIMIAAHPLSFMNSSPLLFLYGVFCTAPQRNVYIKAFTIGAAAGVAMLMTGFFWGPSLLEKGFVLGPAGLPINVFSSFQKAQAWLNPLEYRAPGPVIAATGLAGFVLALRRLGRDGIAAQPALAGLLPAVALYALMVMPVSAPLWKMLGILQSNIFVWRLVYPLNLSLALLLAIVAQPLIEPPRQDRNRTLAMLLSVAATANALLFMLAASWRYIEPGTDEVRRLIESGREPYNTSVDPWGSREYLPNPAATPQAPAACADAKAIAVTRSADGLAFTVDPADRHTCLQLPWYWNTRYRATIDGSAVDLYAGTDGSLLLTPDGRAGPGLLQVERPAYVTRLRYLSLATLLGWLAWLMAGLAATRRQE